MLDLMLIDVRNLNDVLLVIRVKIEIPDSFRSKFYLYFSNTREQ